MIAWPNLSGLESDFPEKHACCRRLRRELKSPTCQKFLLLRIHGVLSRLRVVDWRVVVLTPWRLLLRLCTVSCIVPLSVLLFHKIVTLQRPIVSPLLDLRDI